MRGRRGQRRTIQEDERVHLLHSALPPTPPLQNTSKPTKALKAKPRDLPQDTQTRHTPNSTHKGFPRGVFLGKTPPTPPPEKWTHTLTTILPRPLDPTLNPMDRGRMRTAARCAVRWQTSRVMPATQTETCTAWTCRPVLTAKTVKAAWTGAWHASTTEAPSTLTRAQDQARTLGQTLARTLVQTNSRTLNAALTMTTTTTRAPTALPLCPTHRLVLLGLPMPARNRTTTRAQPPCLAPAPLLRQRLRAPKITPAQLQRRPRLPGLGLAAKAVLQSRPLSLSHNPTSPSPGQLP